MTTAAERPDPEAILRDAGALLADDHFVYISGQHGSGWIDKDAVYVHTASTSALGALTAEAVRDEGVEIVCGPATGGLILAQWTAHHLGALAVFGEHGEPASHEHHADGTRPFVLKRGYDRLVAGRTVLVVDDVVNTGFSIRGTIEAVREHGGIVRTAAAVANRGALRPEANVVERLVCLADIRLDSWPRE
ncbi:MAG TPA: phosphoribosyltransferase family protein, partial [Solirubrobacteraceae bacterium]